MPQLFSKGEVPPAKVAFLVSEELYQFHNATFHDPGFASPVDHLAHTIRGIYKSLWDEGIPVDFLLDSQLETRGANLPGNLVPVSCRPKALLDPAALQLRVQWRRTCLRGMSRPVEPVRLGFTRRLCPNRCERFSAPSTKRSPSFENRRTGLSGLGAEAAYGDTISVP